MRQVVPGTAFLRSQGRVEVSSEALPLVRRSSPRCAEYSPLLSSHSWGTTEPCWAGHNGELVGMTRIRDTPLGFPFEIPLGSESESETARSQGGGGVRWGQGNAAGEVFRNPRLSSLASTLSLEACLSGSWNHCLPRTISPPMLWIPLHSA